MHTKLYIVRFKVYGHVIDSDVSYFVEVHMSSTKFL